MPPLKPPSLSAAGVNDAITQVFDKHLPQLWAQKAKGAPPLFQSGIEFISLSVKWGPGEISVTVAGKDSPGTLMHYVLPGGISRAVVG